MFRRFCIVFSLIFWAMSLHLSAREMCDSVSVYLSPSGDTINYRYTPDTIEMDSLYYEEEENKGFLDFLESTSKFFVQDTTKRKKISFLVLPEFTYSDIYGFGLGATGRIHINNYTPLLSGRKRRQTFIDASFDMSFKGNMSFAISPEIYLCQDRMLLRGYIGYGHYPSSFWGIGPDTTDDMKEEYDKNNFMFRSIIYWRLMRNLYVGGGVHYYDYGTGKIKEGGLLDSGFVLGADGYKAIGLSAHLMYDTRDYQFVPMKGTYIQVDGYYNSTVFGSTTNYSKHIFDLRYYWSTGKSSVVALNWYSQICIGDVPFQEMQGISNGRHSRGYTTNRFIDKDLSSFQAEYRYYVGRFGFAGFASAAGVGSDFFRSLTMDKVSFGGGIRFKVFRNQKMYFRGDVGVNIKGEAQIYLGLDELF